MSKIYNNIFTKTIIEYYTDFSNRNSPKERYISNVFSRYVNIIDELDKLKIIFSHIKKIDINDSDSIENLHYHYDYFKIKAITVIDTCSRLINDSYLLGLKGNSINLDNFKKKKSVLGIRLYCFFENFYNQYKALRNNERNVIIHEGGFKNKMIDDLDSNMRIKSLLDKYKLTDPSHIDSDVKLHNLNQENEMIITNMENSIIKILELIVRHVKSNFNKMPSR